MSGGFFAASGFRERRAGNAAMAMIQFPFLFSRRSVRFAVVSGIAVLGAALSAGAEAEYRGLWVDAWREGIKSEEQVEQLVADARAGNFNLILPNIRRSGDAFYESRVEPRAAELDGDFDPLEALIRHAREGEPRIEIHPWIVTYPLWHRETRAPRQPEHVFNQHPDWMTRNRKGEIWDGGTYSLDPGHPGVQDHIHSIAMDLLEHYEVDGLHFDYIRYRTPEWGYNEVAVERFNRIHGRGGLPGEQDPEWLQFRRDQVTDLLRRVFLAAKERRPDAVISAATITWVPGPETDEDWMYSAAYRRVLQDWRAWMEEGLLDVSMPMSYFEHDRYPVAWKRWNRFIKDHRYGRHAAIGVGFFDNRIADTLQQIRDTREPSAQDGVVQGLIGYSYRNTNKDGVPRDGFLRALVEPSEFDGGKPPVFAEPAKVPSAPALTVEGAGHIRGAVRLPDGDGKAADVRVKLSGPVEREIRTDAAGYFGSLGLPAGDYRIQVLSGESGASEEVSGTAVAVVRAGRVVSEDVIVE